MGGGKPGVPFRFGQEAEEPSCILYLSVNYTFTGGFFSLLVLIR